MRKSGMLFCMPKNAFFHCAPPPSKRKRKRKVYALTRSHDERGENVCNVHFIIISPYSYNRFMCILIESLSYPPMKTLRFMGNFDHVTSMVNGPHNLKPSYVREGVQAFMSSKTTLLSLDHKCFHLYTTQMIGGYPIKKCNHIRPTQLNLLRPQSNNYIINYCFANNLNYTKRWMSILFSLFSMTPLGNVKNVVLSRRRLLVNMTNGLKLSYYQGNTKT